MSRPAAIDVLIVGAGFAGLYMLYRAQRMGLHAQLVEQADDVGGVWYYNRYPGARCDVPSLEYSYSFSEELQQEWNWSERYAAQPEILAYLRHVAERFDLRRHIRFGTRVHSARFDTEAGRWHVDTDRCGRLTAQFCILATGPLSVPQTPDWPGLPDFQGRVLHTGRWPHDGVDLRHRRVAIIGTGSSGIQAIPVIAAEAEHLVVLQRTANFVIPSRNAPMDDATLAKAKAGYPELRARAKQVGTLYEFSDRSALAVSDAERDAEYERRWAKGGVNFIHSFKDITLDLDANATAAEFVRRKIRSVVRNPETADRLCPTDHPIGTKRICVGSDYFETYNRANVTLVDLKRTPVTRVLPDAIATAEETYPVDVLVCATGYDALTGAVNAIEIRGKDDQLLRDTWQAGPRTFLGLMTHGFPNLFFITGPGSPSVLVNLVVGLEQHVEWIAQCIGRMRTAGHDQIEAESSAEDAWVKQVNDAAAGTLMTRSNSWYLGANVPGKPRVFMPFVGGIGRYRAICDGVAADGYRGFRIGPGSTSRTPHSIQASAAADHE
jgi:cyclohexanone monooxygenase